MKENKMEFKTLTIPKPGETQSGDSCTAMQFEEFRKALFVVCDGLSGSRPNFASNYATRTISERLISRLSGQTTNIDAIIKEEMDKINDELKAESAGTTMELAYLDKESQILHTAHIGDSRIYLINGTQNLNPFTSAVPEQITPDQSHADENRGPSNCLGIGGVTKIHPNRFDLSKMADTVFMLMCTDGLTSYKVTQRELTNIFQNYTLNQELHAIMDTFEHLIEHPYGMITEGLEEGGITKGYWRNIAQHFAERGYQLDTDDYHRRRDMILPLIEPRNPDHLMYRALFADAYATAVRVHDDVGIIIADLKDGRKEFMQKTILTKRAVEVIKEPVMTTVIPPQTPPPLIGNEASIQNEVAVPATYDVEKTDTVLTGRFDEEDLTGDDLPETTTSKGPEVLPGQIPTTEGETIGYIPLDEVPSEEGELIPEPQTLGELELEDTQNPDYQNPALEEEKEEPELDDLRIRNSELEARVGELEERLELMRDYVPRNEHDEIITAHEEAKDELVQGFSSLEDELREIIANYEKSIIEYENINSQLKLDLEAKTSEAEEYLRNATGFKKNLEAALEREEGEIQNVQLYSQFYAEKIQELLRANSIIKDLTEKNSELETNIYEIRTELEGKIAEIEADKKTLVEGYEGLLKGYDERTNKLVQEKDELSSDYEARIQTLTKEKDAAIKEKEELDKNYGGRVSELETELEQANTEKDRLVGEKEELSIGYEARIQTLTEEKERLDRDYGGKVSELETQLEQTNIEKDRLVREKEELSIGYEARLQTLTEEKETLTEEKERLDRDYGGRVSELETQLEKANAEKITLVGEKEELTKGYEKRVQTLTKEKVKIMEEVVIIIKEVQRYKTKLETAETKIRDLKRIHSEYITEAERAQTGIEEKLFGFTQTIESLEARLKECNDDTLRERATALNEKEIALGEYEIRLGEKETGLGEKEASLDEIAQRLDEKQRALGERTEALRQATEELMERLGYLPNEVIETIKSYLKNTKLQVKTSEGTYSSKSVISEANKEIIERLVNEGVISGAPTQENATKVSYEGVSRREESKTGNGKGIYYHEFTIEGELFQGERNENGVIIRKDAPIKYRISLEVKVDPELKEKTARLHERGLYNFNQPGPLTHEITNASVENTCMQIILPESKTSNYSSESIIKIFYPMKDRTTDIGEKNRRIGMLRKIGFPDGILPDAGLEGQDQNPETKVITEGTLYSTYQSKLSYLIGQLPGALKKNDNVSFLLEYNLPASTVKHSVQGEN